MTQVRSRSGFDDGRIGSEKKKYGWLDYVEVKVDWLGDRDSKLNKRTEFTNNYFLPWLMLIVSPK